MHSTEKKRYLLHARRALPKKRVSAVERIEAGFAKIPNPVISLSFGKDSLVMTHLILTHFQKLPVVYVDCGLGDEWPDTERVIREFLEICPCELITLRGPSILEAFRESGFFLEEAPELTGNRAAEKRYNASLVETIDTYCQQRGHGGSFVGLRRQESRNRDRLFTMRSACYYAKTRGLYVCCPLEHWTAVDIWAYIVEQGLPYNELYDISTVGRELARNGAMFGNIGHRYGRLVELKRTYPDWFHRLVKEFPEIRRYV